MFDSQEPQKKWVAVDDIIKRLDALPISNVKGNGIYDLKEQLSQK